MKKIISFMVAMAMLLSMVTAFAAVPTGYTESGIAFTQEWSVVNTNNVPGRMWGIANYSVGGRDFVYVISNKMFTVYDVTDGQPKTVQTIPEITGNSGYPIVAFDGNLYVTTTANTTYRFPIKSDGTLDIDTSNLTQYRIVSGFTAKLKLWVDNDKIAGVDTINRLFVAPNSGNSDAEARFTAGTVRGSDVIKLSNGKYRFVCLEKESADADTIAVYDYDPENKTFSTLARKTVFGVENFPAANAADILMVNENCAAVSLKTVNGSANYIYKVDFAQDSVTAVKIAEYAQSASTYGQVFSKADNNRLVAWGVNTVMYDISGSNWSDIGNYNWGKTNAKPLSIAKVGDTYYIAADDETRAVKIEDQQIVEYTVDRVKSCIPNPGEVTQATIGIDARNIAAAVKNGKNILYARDFATGAIYEYDVTEPGSPSLVKTYDFGFAASVSKPILVYGDSLLAVDSKYVYSIPIVADGSLGAKAVAVTASSDITNMEITDTLLAVGTASNIVAYDISDMSAIKNIGTVLNNSYRSYAIEKATSHSYRAYVLQAAKTSNGNGTLNLKIIEIRNGLSGVAITTKFDGIPDLSEVNVWPSYGIYGSDEKVSGYVRLGTQNMGAVFVAGENCIRVALPAVNNMITSGALGNGDIIVDCKDPTKPKVSFATDFPDQVGNARSCQVKIDDYTSVEIPQYDFNNGQANAYSISTIKDYTNPYLVKTKNSINGLVGMCGAAAGNMVYTTDRNKILRAVKVYDNLTDYTVYPITVTDRNGNVADTVAPALLTASADVYNPGAPKNVVMIMAMYDAFSNALNYTQIKTVTVPTGISAITDTIDMEQLDNYSAYTKYLRVFLWDGMDTVKPQTASKKIDAVTVEGASFDIWIPENTETVKGLALVHRHGIGESLKDMQAFKSLCADMDLAIMSFIDGDGLLKGFEDYEQCGQVIMNQISEYAASTGHPELETVPLATFGHSNSTAFASRFADWVPERMFAVIAYKSANSTQIEYDNIAKNNIPMLIMTGETDFGYGYENQIYAAERMLESGGLVQYIQDPGAGHGPTDWKSNTIMFEFLKRAFEAKVAEDGTIKQIDPTTGYYGYGTYPLEDSSETRFGYIYKYTPTGYMTYSEYMAAKEADPNFKAQAWLFDKTYADQWVEFNKNGIITVNYPYQD